MTAPLLGALTAIGLISATGAGVAIAAPPYDTTATISNVQFVTQPVVNGRTAEISAEWSFPDNATGKLGIVIPLPSTLVGRGDTFRLTSGAPDNVTIGSCVATATEVQCDLDPTFVAENPRSLKGNVNFWATVQTTNTTTTIETFEIAGQRLEVEVEATPPPCTENCGEFNWDWKKDGNIDYATNTIVWYVHIQGTEGGFEPGWLVEVADQPDGNQELVIDAGWPRLAKTDKLDPSGVRPDTNAWQHVLKGSDDPSQFQATDDGKVSFVTESGYYYQVEYKTRITGESAEYLNSVVANNGTETQNVQGTVNYAGGGGTGSGTNVGTFTITKDVTGSAVNLPADQEFTGTYTVTPPTGDPATGTYAVKAGETWTSPEYPRDSTVTLTEDTPSTPQNVAWTSSFSTNDFTLVGGTRTDVTLTNEATTKLGTFTASKSITGDAAELVPADRTFTVDYSYPAGVGFEAGSGSLTLTADGAAVASPDLPVGAEVTLSEQDPAEVDGASWGAPVISPETFTVADGTPVAVTIENPIAVRYGGFSLAKSVTGPASGLVLDDTAFTVDYAWTTPDGRSGDGSIDVLADGSVASVDTIPFGATVTLTEQAAPEIEGVEWGEPVFSPTEFTVAEGDLTQVALENPTTLRTGQFSVLKKIDGSGAALVDPQTAFTVGYSYPAGEGFDAGSGELTVHADGEVVLSDPLPYGAVVTLTEQAPVAVEGGTWTASAFDTAELVIGEGTVVEAVLTNTIDSNPPAPTPPAQPTPATTPVPAPALAHTGGEVSVILGVGAALAVAAGLLLVMRRRMSHSAE